MDNSLRDLSQLTEAIFRAELNKMRDVNLREARLRKKLAELETSAIVNSTLPSNELTPVRQIGADVLWQGWVARARRELNIELAQVLTEKARMTALLRQEFGRKTTAAELFDDACLARDSNQEKQHLKTQEHLQMMNIGKGL